MTNLNSRITIRIFYCMASKYTDVSQLLIFSLLNCTKIKIILKLTGAHITKAKSYISLFRSTKNVLFFVQHRCIEPPKSFTVRRVSKFDIQSPLANISIPFIILDLPFKLSVVHIRKKNKKFRFSQKMAPMILIKFCAFIVHSKLNNVILQIFPGKS